MSATQAVNVLGTELSLTEIDRIKSPALRSILEEQFLLLDNEEANHYSYDKFTHTKSTSTCVCLIGGL